MARAGPSSRSSNRAAFWLASVGTSVICLVSLLAIWLTWDLRAEMHGEAGWYEQEMTDCAAVLVEHAIASGDLVLREILRRLGPPNAAIMLPSNRSDALLHDAIATGVFRTIAVTDASGQIIDASDPGMIGRIRLADREFFAAHRTRPSSDLVISGPFRGIASDRTVIVLSHRRETPNGKFAGIVIGSIEVAAIQDKLRKLILTNQIGSFPPDSDPVEITLIPLTDAVRHADQGPVAVSQFSDAAPLQVGSSWWNEGVVHHAALRGSSGTLTAHPSPDGRTRVLTLRKIEHAPLALSVAFATEKFDWPWGRKIWIAGVTGATADVGAILLCFGIRRELRRRRETERAASVSEQWFNLKIESLGDHALFSLDKDGRVRSWNKGAMNLLLYRAEEILDRPLDTLFPTIGAAFNETLRVARYLGRSSEQTICRKKDGSQFTVILTIVAVEPLGDSVMYVIAIQDVSERIGLEARIRRMERMDVIGQLAVGATHDFNNLLQAQIGSLEILMDGASRGTLAHELAETALNAARQATRLTDQILGFSRNPALHPSVVSLPHLMHQLTSLTRPIIGSSIRLSCASEAGLQAIFVDEPRLQTALLNLLLNARDAIAGAGTITLETGVGRIDVTTPGHILRDGAYAVVSVEDSGCGMDEATLHQAFEPYFTTKGAGGSGLGLSMVQNFVHQSGGEIHIRSVQGVGTRVELYLPFLESAAPPFPLPSEQGRLACAVH